MNIKKTLTTLFAAACMTFTFQAGASHDAQLNKHLSDYFASRDYDGGPGNRGNMWHRKSHKHEKYKDYERSYLHNHNLYGLTGASEKAALNRIHQRGYHLQSSIHVDNSKIGYWWNSHHNTCIAVKTKAGRLLSVVNQPNRMCRR